MAQVKRIDARSAAPRVTSEILDRVPPHDLEAEKAVLGSLLLDPLVCDDVAMVVRATDFYSQPNQLIFAHLMDLHNAGRRVDHMLLMDALKKANEYEPIGGKDYLTEVIQSVPSAANAKYYAQIVRDKATLRTLIHAGTEIIRDAYDQSFEARELLSQAESKVFAILEQKALGELKPIQDVLHEAFDRINARLNRGGGLSGIETGFTELDQLTGGFHESELIILAARPSMGKTALALNIAEHAAVRQKHPVLVVSLEMSRLELGERLLCSHGRINGHKLRNGVIMPVDHKKLIDASATISQAPLFIDDSPTRTMTEIAATARRLKRSSGLKLVVIDYLQLIEPDNPKDQRQEQVAKIARRLKGLARELSVPVLCLAQLNRQAEASREMRPKLSHLRESGAIEQDADVVMFVHREEYYETDEEKRARVAGQAEVIVAKQRNGPVGDKKLAFLKDYARFENLATTADYVDFT